MSVLCFQLSEFRCPSWLHFDKCMRVNLGISEMKIQFSMEPFAHALKSEGKKRSNMVNLSTQTHDSPSIWYHLPVIQTEIFPNLKNDLVGLTVSCNLRCTGWYSS